MAADTTLALLRKIPLFESLDDAALETLSTRCRRRRFGAGEVLFHEGDPGQTLYLIHSGWISIEKTDRDGNPIPIARRGPGEFFGELALLDEEPRSADAVTEGACVLGMLDRRELIRFFHEHPDAAWSLIRTLSSRLREASDRLREDRSGDALQRMAALLATEAHDSQAGARGERELPYSSTQRLAQRLGVTREHASRTLTRLREQGVLRREGRRLIVADLARLQRLGDR